jgi:CO dehydrogenase/acetyl-CoA synthase alpha subunit
MAKIVTSLCVLCNIHAIGEERVCITEKDCIRSDVWAEAEETVVHRAYSTTYNNQMELHKDIKLEVWLV